MDKALKQSMLAYYDERASEYDEIDTLGTGSTAINAPSAYQEETTILQRVVNEVCAGDILDIPCGTAFWLPSYAQGCTTALLVDQSASMLDESRRRARQAGVADRCQFLQCDIFDSAWPHQRFDVVLMGFFISHLTTEEEARILARLRNSLKPNGKFLVLDSAWSTGRARTRVKEGEQMRRLNNGTEFPIYKKYFERRDIEAIGTQHQFEVTIHHVGRTFCAFSGNMVPGTQ